MKIYNSKGTLVGEAVKKNDVWFFSKKISWRGSAVSGQDLRFISARGTDWSGSDFRETNFTQADLSRATLRGVDFRGGIFLYCRFRECEFDTQCKLHWRSHDLLAGVLRFCARQAYERTGNTEQFVRQGLYSSVPITFREWCWPEYDAYLPKDVRDWMVTALRPWVEAETDKSVVPPELMKELGNG